MRKNNTDKLFDRWIKNPGDHFTFDELNELLHYIDKDSVNNSDSKHIEDFLAKNWEKAEETNEAPEFKLEENFAGIMQTIKQEEFAAERRDFRSKVHKGFNFIAKVAAILILPVTIMILMDDGFAGKSDSFVWNVEYFSQPASRTRIFLPDSTEVWLNSNSKLEVMHGFGKVERSVKLTGEAYFSVTKNNNLPFNVYAQGVNIKVHGTEFNISAYEDQDSVETVLLNGSISLKHSDYPGDQGIKMVPGQRINYYKQADSVRSDFVDAQAFGSWKDGIIIFNDSPMEEVQKKLERWFNVSIIIEDESLMNYRITGVLENRTLDQIMRFISLTSPVDYKQEGDKVYMKKR